MLYPASTRISRHAFTLVEVLTALGIFALAVLGLLHALNVTVDASRNVQRQKEIRRELESRLARLSIAPLNQSSSSSERRGVQYHEEVRPEPIKAANLSILPGYWIVRVSAEWKDGTQLRDWSASHLIWNP